MKRIVPILMILLTASCYRTTVDEYPIENHSDGEFINVQSQERFSDGSDFARMLLTKPLGKWPRWIENTHKPHLLKDGEGGVVAVTYINHSSFLVQIDGFNALIDPVFTNRLGPLGGFVKRRRAPGIALDDLPDIDLVLISHNHYDHLDVDSLLELRSRDEFVLGVPLGDEKWLHEAGLTNAVELGWWQELDTAGGVKATFVPAQHFSGRTATDRNKSFWGGWVLQFGGFTLYHAGDTGMSPHFAEIARRFGKIDLAMLPIGAYKPRWFMEFVHIGPVQAVEAHQILKPSVSIAMHHDTFQQGFENYGEAEYDLRRARRAAGLTAKEFAIMNAGKTVRFVPK